MSDYRLVEQVPSVEDYNRVRTEADLSKRDPAAAKVGLPNTQLCVCAKSGERVVGIGRIIGDGGLFFQVVDVAIVPEHQGEGLGAMVMDALMSWLRGSASSDAYVQLIAAERTTGFYERYGFRVRTPEGSDMSFMTL